MTALALAQPPSSPAVVVHLNVLGTPAPKGSSRPMINRKTGVPFTFAGGSKVAEQKLKSWDVAVREAALMAAPAVSTDARPTFVDVPLEVTITFRLTRPAGHWGKGKRAGTLLPSAPARPRGKPDIDKLARSTLDSLIGSVMDDDSRIVRLVLDKVYAAPGHEGASISICEATV